MNITYRQMQKEDIAKVTPLFIEYWNGTGDEWTPALVYSVNDEMHEHFYGKLGYGNAANLNFRVIRL